MNRQNKIKVLLLFGGVSSEHEVSLMSAVSVIGSIPTDKYDILLVGITKDGRWVEYSSAIESITSMEWEKDTSLKSVILSTDSAHKGILVLDGSKYTFKAIDICFPVLHGKNGEDGTIQGLLELAGIPFVGSNMISSSNCMDKEVTHIILESNGVEMAKSLCYRRGDNFDLFEHEAVQKLKYPMFVKPANAGSSVGVSKAHNKDELKTALETALHHDRKAIVEEFVDGLEVETAVIGNDEVQVAPLCGELTPASEFYTYEAKYIDGTTAQHIPARVPDETIAKLRETAKKAFTAMGCQGFARVDFFVNRNDNKVILNEINTIPGFTPISMYPKLWESSGTPYTELLDKLLQLGLSRPTV